MSTFPLPSAARGFTDRWILTGPNTAISCEVAWDSEGHHFHAISDAGFHGAADYEADAALQCFTAWITSRRGWFVPEPQE